jgi:hypothetical protein
LSNSWCQHWVCVEQVFKLWNIMDTTEYARLPVVLERLGRYLIAAVFFYAAFPKLFDVRGFADVIEAYAIVPDDAVLLFAVLLPVTEIILAVGLLINVHKATIGSLLLLLLFIAVLSYSIHLGLDIDCGCFGPEDPEHLAFQGLRTALIRDLVLVIPLVYSLWFFRNGKIIKQSTSGEKDE